MKEIQVGKEDKKRGREKEEIKADIYKIIRVTA